MNIDYLKNKVKTPEFIITAISVVLGLISIIMYSVCVAATENYFINAGVYILIILAIGIQVVSLLVQKIGDNHLIKNLVGIVSTMLYVFALIILFVSSLEWIQHLLSKDNVPAFDYSYVVAIVFFILSFVTQIIANFFHRSED